MSTRQLKAGFKARGYVLLPVAVAIALIALLAFLSSRESSLGVNSAVSEFEAAQARYVAQAGLQHALRELAQQGCGAYTDLTNVSFGGDRYSTNLTTDLGSTTSYSISVDQDGWIRSDLPTQNRGPAPKLHIRFEFGISERPMYRYDLSSIPANSAILSAKAWFYLKTEHSEGPVDIHRITGAWSEAGATWDNMNTKMDNVVLASIPAQPANGVWESVNLTSQVQSWVNGQANYGITMNTGSEGMHGEYFSRESANAPYLEVIVGTPPSSPVSLQSVGTLLNGVSRSVTRDDVGLFQHPPAYHQQQLDLGSGKDAMIDAFYNIRNHGDYVLKISSDPGWLINTLIQFDLPALAPGVKIESARLELYHQVTTGSSIDPAASVLRLTRDWIEGTMSGIGVADGATWDTWDGSNSWTTGGGDYNALPFASSTLSAATGDWESWDIKTLVQGWVDGTFPNYGLLLKGAGTVNMTFASAEDADPTLHPRLSITYSCQCGKVCLLPQGDGVVLMAVANQAMLTPEDVYKKALFESWGYTVSIIQENESKASYDSAIATSNVVFISDSVTYSQVGDRLVDASIGVIKQDDDYNADLGIAAGNNWEIGAAIDVTDNGHYITRLFPLGPLAIYAAGMEQSTVSGSEANGLQTLAEAGGAGSLVVLDTGAELEGGGNAAGRRVMLPLGRDSNFKWDYLNSNGRVLVQRALDWGAGNDVDCSDGNFRDQFDLNAFANSDGSEAWSGNWIELDSAGAGAGTGKIRVAAGELRLNGAPSADDPNVEREMDLSTFRSATLAFDLRNSVEVDAGADSAVVEISSDGGGSWTELEDFVDEGSAASGSRSYDITPYMSDNTRVRFRVNQLYSGSGEFFYVDNVDIAASCDLLPPLVPVAHWKLDETSGATAVDLLGGHDATLVNAPVWTAGLFNGGLDFDGVDDTVGAGPAVGLNDVFHTGATLSAWIHPDTWGEGNLGRIADKSDATTLLNGWAFQLDGSNQALMLQAGYSGATGRWTTPIGSIDLDRWQHVALVFDGSSDSNDPVIYIDGVAQAITELDPPSGSPSSDAAYNFTIGNHAQATSRTFDGMIDDVRLFDRLLSTAEVEQLATLPGPVAHWKLDDGAGVSALDSAGGNDGTLTNGPIWTTGLIDEALDFDGSNDYVSAGTFDVSGSGLTMMGWFNADTLPNSDPRIISKASGNGGNDTRWQLGIIDSAPDHYLRMRVRAGGATSTLTDSSVSLTTGQWYFAVATYDAGSGDMKLYLDGIEIANGAHAVGGMLDTDPAVKVALGANGNADRFFDGVLDDLRVYDRALGSSEIFDIYEADAPPVPAVYTESYQGWSASSDNIWQTIDLSALGVPADAVVEVAITNKKIDKKRSGGVRALGSALQRRFQLHEAEDTGVDALVMHVQADSSSRIEHYAEKKNEIKFTLLGYWTGTAYVESFSKFTAGGSNAWRAHNLAGQDIAPNQVAEIVMANTSQSNQRVAGLRPSGASYQRRFSLHEAENGGIDAATLMVESDASSMVEVFAEADAEIDFYVVGYWATPPGSYTATGGVNGQVAAAASWQTADLTTFGIPADAVAQFVLTNDSDNNANKMGVRATGSSLDRLLDLHEAEAGGADTATMQVKVDGSSQVEWYAESGAVDRFFYPVGWWILSP